MVILDLEWNQPFYSAEAEILQIGAVKVKKLGGSIQDQFNAYIFPQRYESLSAIAKELPDADKSYSEGISFADAYRAFADWCGDETVFASWGLYDFTVLKKSAKHEKERPLNISECVDLQAAFGRTLGTGRCIALKDAVSYCGIPEAFTFHNGLHDAMYAATVSEWINEAAMEAPLPKMKDHVAKKDLAFCETPYERQHRQRVGPFKSVSALLNAVQARHIPCPICGKDCVVMLWYPRDERTYYGPFACKEHGRFMGRVAVTPDERGQWCGKRSTPIINHESLTSFAKARVHEPHQCRASGHKKNKNAYWRRRRQAEKCKV